MGIEKRVTNQDAVLKMLKYLLLLQDDTTDTVDCCWKFLPLARANVLVSVGTIDIARILVETKIELCTVLDDGLVERRKENMILTIQLRNRNYQQTVILTRIAVHDG